MKQVEIKTFFVLPTTHSKTLSRLLMISSSLADNRQHVQEKEQGGASFFPEFSILR